MAEPIADQQAQAAEPADPKVAANGNTAPGAEPDPFVVLENFKAENAALKDRVLRMLADTENLRRRTDKEVTDAKSYGVSNFAREMLNVADNLRRAIANAPVGQADSPDALKHLLAGVELTERDLLSRLARFGVKPLDPEGKRFDPNMHEALFEIPDESVPAGTVKQVVETGYSIGERVLRPAKVGVSRGGPKAVAE